MKSLAATRDRGVPRAKSIPRYGKLTLLGPLSIMRFALLRLSGQALMRSMTFDYLTKRLRGMRLGLAHAFATRTEFQPLTLVDVELMDRVAAAIVTRGMAAPATVFLESFGPMNFLGSQALHFLTPILEFAFDVKELEQVARLLERRETISRLIALIEAKSAPRAPQVASAQ